MPRETPSPIDLPGPARVNGGGSGGLAWAAVTIAVACLLLLVGNAVALQGWIDEQRPGPLQAWAAARVDAWVGFTDRLGLSAPREHLHARWKAAEAARFGGDAAQR